MPRTFSCPHCQAPISTYMRVGEAATCSACGNPTPVPEDSQQVAPTAPSVQTVAPTPGPTPKAPALFPTWMCVGLVPLAALLSIPIVILEALDLDSELTNVLSYLVGMGLTFAVVYGIWGRHPLLRYRFTMPGRMVVLLLIVFTIAELFLSGTLSSLIPITDLERRFLESLELGTGWGTFISFVFLAPLLEELVWRGIVLQSLLYRWTPWRAIVLSSIAFGLAHMNTMQFVLAFFGGLAMGWVYLRTRSLAPVMLMHAAANTTGYVLRLWMDEPEMQFGLDATLRMYGGGVTRFTLVTILLVLVLLLCIRELRKRLPVASWNRDSAAVSVPVPADPPG